MKKTNKYIVELVTTVILIIAILCIYSKGAEDNTMGFATGMGTILGIYPVIFILFMVAGFKFAK